jgi:hypothetical protein
MAVGAILPDGLAYLKGLEFSDQPGADNKTDYEGGNRGVDCPERDITKDIKIGIGSVKRI